MHCSPRTLVNTGPLDHVDADERKQARSRSATDGEENPFTATMTGNSCSAASRPSPADRINGHVKYYFVL
jgi:hypothetical protein